MPDDCASRLKILADETRLAVLRVLLDGERTVSDIADALQAEQTLLSHHLKVLRKADLVTVAKDGKSRRYRLADGVAAPEQHGQRFIDIGCCKLVLE